MSLARGIGCLEFAWLLVTLGTPVLAIQLANGWNLIDIPLVQPWFYERFRGWSDNPNQLSLCCAVLALLSLHLADRAIGLSGRIVALTCAILPIYIGRMTMSDTFTLALVVSIPIYTALKVWAWLHSGNRGNIMPFAFACTIIIGLPLLMISLAPLAVDAASEAGILVNDLSKNGGKELRQELDLRFSLWTQAIRLGIDSSMLGLGPGPHLEIPASVLAGRMGDNQPENIVHPEQNATPNFEAHNTFLDLLTQGGMIAVLSFVWITFVAALHAHKVRAAGLAALICGLSLFCMTGLVIRQIPLVLVFDRPLSGRGACSRPTRTVPIICSDCPVVLGSAHVEFRLRKTPSAMSSMSNSDPATRDRQFLSDASCSPTE